MIPDVTVVPVTAADLVVCNFHSQGILHSTYWDPGLQEHNHRPHIQEHIHNSHHSIGLNQHGAERLKRLRFSLYTRFIGN